MRLQPFMSPRYAGGPRPPIRMGSQVLYPLCFYHTATISSPILHQYGWDWDHFNYARITGTDYDVQPLDLVLMIGGVVADLNSTPLHSLASYLLYDLGWLNIIFLVFKVINWASLLGDILCETFLFLSHCRRLLQEGISLEWPGTYF